VEGGVFGRLWNLCLGFLFAAVTVYVAVQVLQAVLWWLLGMTAVVAAGWLVVQLMRARRDRFW
jgi:Kef-type K+ transport system membrane component KefB